MVFLDSWAFESMSTRAHEELRGNHEMEGDGVHSASFESMSRGEGGLVYRHTELHKRLCCVDRFRLDIVSGHSGADKGYRHVAEQNVVRGLNHDIANNGTPGRVDFVRVMLLDFDLCPNLIDEKRLQTVSLSDEGRHGDESFGSRYKPTRGFRMLDFETANSLKMRRMASRNMKCFTHVGMCS